MINFKGNTQKDVFTDVDVSTLEVSRASCMMMMSRNISTFHSFEPFEENADVNP